MTREEMIKLIGEMTDCLSPEDWKRFMNRCNMMVYEIENLTVRVEISISGGAVNLDSLEATGDIRFIMDIVDHDEETFNAEVDGRFIENLHPLESLKKRSTLFGNHYDDEDYERGLVL